MKPVDLNMLHNEPVIFLPDDVIRKFEKTMWMMEKSLREFEKVAEEMKPVEESGIRN
jgi:hypothetical protein